MGEKKQWRRAWQSLGGGALSLGAAQPRVEATARRSRARAAKANLVDHPAISLSRIMMITADQSFRRPDLKEIANEIFFLRESGL